MLLCFGLTATTFLFVQGVTKTTMHSLSSVRLSLVLGLILGAFAFTTTIVVSPGEAQAQSRAKKKRVTKKRTRKKSRSLGISKTVIGLRGGLVLNGSGTTEVSNNGTSLSGDYTDKTSLGISGLALFPIGNSIRVGGTVWYLPGVNLENTENNSSNDTDNLPSQISINAMGEYNFKIRKRTYAYGFGEVGYALLMPPAPENGEEEGPTASGLNIAIGGGVTYVLNKQFGVRAEARYTPYYALASEDSGITTTANGQRLMVNLGILYGL